MNVEQTAVSCSNRVLLAYVQVVEYTRGVGETKVLPCRVAQEGFGKIVFKACHHTVNIANARVYIKCSNALQVAFYLFYHEYPLAKPHFFYRIKVSQ